MDMERDIQAMHASWYELVPAKGLDVIIRFETRPISLSQGSVGFTANEYWI